jgi:nucleoside-diphosphate-sugar epimerase
MDLPALVNCIKDYQPNYLIHLAAKTDLSGKSLKEYELNVQGTQNIITAIRQVNTIKKVIFASSMLVCRTGYLPSHEKDFKPDTVYGHSKMEMEKLIHASELNTSWVIVRPTSIWGPWFKSPYRDFFDIVSKKKFIDIGSKYCTKTYGFIGNTVYQIHQILLNPSTDSNVYYLGDEPPVFISEWAREITEAMGIELPRRIPYLFLHVAAKVGDILKMVGISFPMTSFRLRNMTTNNVIDLSATYSVASNPPYTRKQGVIKTIAWLREYKN